MSTTNNKYPWHDVNRLPAWSTCSRAAAKLDQAPDTVYLFPSKLAAGLTSWDLYWPARHYAHHTLVWANEIVNHE